MKISYIPNWKNQGKNKVKQNPRKKLINMNRNLKILKINIKEVENRKTVGQSNP